MALNRKKCTSIVKNVIANAESAETINNDLTDHKCMCALVRYMSPMTGRVRTESLELISLDATDCSAEKIYNVFKNCLVSKSIPLTNILGLASDGANVNVGKNNSFFSHRTKDVPSAILMRCLCHSLLQGRPVKNCQEVPKNC